jgi:acrylyl-CoA reductase (NADPH)
MFKAMMLRQDGERVSALIEEIAEDALPAGDVTVAVEWSTLNYKDGLVLGGLGRLVRDYPHVPGIDFAGTVSQSNDPRYSPGDKVILTGWHVGERHWGGYAQKARVKADWLVPLPAGLSTRQAMIIGTAGFTAMLALVELERQGVRPERGEVLVTGACGGVGSVAVSALAEAGYTVAASTGRTSEADYLRGLGASVIIPREDLSEPGARPLENERWAGCVDAVGGVTLARVLAQTQHGGCVAAVGLAGGAKLETTVVPFLLRGVRLCGIDSVLCPYETRVQAWQRLAGGGIPALLEAMASEARLEDLPELGRQILKGQVRGRTVIAVQ